MSIIVTTSGSRGIGASVPLECARRGLGVILTYNRNPEAAARVIGSLLTGDGGWINAQNIEVAGGYII